MGGLLFLEIQIKWARILYQLKSRGIPKINANLKETGGGGWRIYICFQAPISGQDVSLPYQLDPKGNTDSNYFSSSPSPPQHYSDETFLNVESMTKDLERKQRRGLHYSTINIFKCNSRHHLSQNVLPLLCRRRISRALVPTRSSLSL